MRKTYETEQWLQPISLPHTFIPMTTITKSRQLLTGRWRSYETHTRRTRGSSELVHAIRLVMRGSTYVTPLMRQDTVGSVVHSLKRRKGPPRLTPRQKEVLQLLAEGRSMKEAAYLLNVTPGTFAYHKYIMMEHLQLRSSAELLEFAWKSSLAGAG